jgi:hypothetical protein
MGLIIHSPSFSSMTSFKSAVFIYSLIFTTFPNSESKIRIQQNLLYISFILQ